MEDFIELHQKNTQSFQQGNSLYFTSNHDENSWNGTVFERLENGASGWATVMALLDGIPLIYSGVEEPLKKRLAFFEKDNIAFDQYGYEGLYKNLFSIKKKYRALHNLPYGEPVEWISTNSNILAFQRKGNGVTISVVFNTAEISQTFDYLPTEAKILMSNQIIQNKTELKAYEYIISVH